MLFDDRFEAGRFLAFQLGEFASRSDVVVLALPRGGVPVGYEVAKAIDAPLDVFVVRKREVERREREYRDGRPAVDVGGRTILLVDDGLATGASMRVAATALRKKSPSGIVVGVPVASPSTCAEFATEVDRVI